jgi:NTP pyrophosphatase (non-canonical NTP hydrolase)
MTRAHHKEHRIHSFDQYVEKALRSKSPGFVRPLLLDGKPVIIDATDKPVMETYAQGPATDFLHATTGGLTEIGGEFCDALKAHLFYGKPLDYVNLGEEIGDSWWYLAIAAAAAKQNLAELDDLIAQSIKLVTRTAENTSPICILQVGNELAADWAKLNEIAISDFQINPGADAYLNGYPDALQTFTAIVIGTAQLGALLGHDVHLIWQSNIAKLLKRYPEKFDAADAQFRRLNEERATLEANHDGEAVTPASQSGLVNAAAEEPAGEIITGEPIHRANLRTFLEAQDGKFVGITYAKKDGSTRKLNGRLGVFKHLKGGSNNVEALDRSYLVLFDVKASGYRTVDLATASFVRALGTQYAVID